jgi:uncharacterized membrane protein YbhN (UPF0104 family)
MTNMGRGIERWFPQVAATLCAVAYWYFLSSLTIPKTAVNILGALVTVAGVAVGFLAAAEAIVLSIDQSKIIQELQRSGFYDLLIRYLHSGLIWSFILSCLSTIGLLKDFEKTNWPPWVVAAWCGVFVATALANARVIYVFDRILRARSRMQLRSLEKPAPPPLPPV